MKMNLEQDLDLAISSAKQAGKYLNELNQVEIISSIGRDIKLQADTQAEEIVLNILREEREYNLLTEETGEFKSKNSSNFYWIVDPLDGSLNFSRNLPICAVSLALWENMEPLLGVIYDFNRNDLYSCIVGEGAWLNGDKISVSKVNSKESAILCTGFPSKSDYSQKNLLNFVNQVQNFKKVRAFGSAALSLAYVACGKVDAYAEKGIMLWDIAAGLALVKSAGGEIRYNPMRGKNQFDVFASNGNFKE